MKRLIECVPNFSEGRDSSVIDAVVRAIADAKTPDGRSVRVLNVDPGEAANRTVVTFAGEPETVCEAAFQGAKKAQELIDMRLHRGKHPRSGAIDVLPLVPVAGISLEECAVLARNLAARMYRELGIPCYCYEAAAFKPERRNLAVCRAGEYEALPEKMADPERRPDFGPESYDETAARSGASNVGARNFLIAVNFNLDTEDAGIAQEIACEVREKGRKTADGTWMPGSLKGCKAIGWHIPEYGAAQVSMNITDIAATPLHEAFEEVSARAQAHGLHVTGTEIIGLVPKKVLLEAGRHFLAKQRPCSEASEEELFKAADKGMALSWRRLFSPSEKVLENLV